jgi:hypothetical protein
VPDSKQSRTDAQRAEWLLAKFANYIAKPVVRGGVEPPAFRFQAHPLGRCMWLDGAWWAIWLREPWLVVA